MPDTGVTRAAQLCVAPMMDWTDRHCRVFHRGFSARTLLYTEMITSSALVRGKALYLLDYSECEHPVAAQLGGSNPVELAEAARVAAAQGYDEINLNVGCPSDRVQSGCFGAVLMRDPDLVARCVAAMIAVSGGVEVTVKCRIGVDEQNPETVLPGFIHRMRESGVKRLAIHARKAWLEGLNPKENREIPPLDYPLILKMKERFPDLEIVINGGIEGLTQAAAFLDQGLDGVMIGRAAYHAPAAVLGAADRVIFGEEAGDVSGEDAVRGMYPYIEAELGKGTRFHHIARHMIGAFAGRPGARRWRQVLSGEAHRDGAGIEVLERGLAEIEERAA